jgi:hypothetical protein
MSRFDEYYSSVIEHQKAAKPTIHQYPARLYHLTHPVAELAWLEDMLEYVACAAAPSPERLAACVATVVDTDEVAGWALPRGQLPGFKPCVHTLVVVLPDEFAGSVLEMSACRPGRTVQSDVDLCRMAPCLRWRAALVDGTTVDVLVPMQLLARDIAKMGERSTAEQWVPTVFVADNTVAAGGFHLDEYLAASCRSARRFVRVNGRPNAPRPMDEHLRSFVERYGLAPWKFGRFREEGTSHPDLLMATPWDEAPR